MSDRSSVTRTVFCKITNLLIKKNRLFPLDHGKQSIFLYFYKFYLFISFYLLGISTISSPAFLL